MGDVKTPLPRFPVQLYGICPSASFMDVQDSVDDCPTAIFAGVNEALQLDVAGAAWPDNGTEVAVPGNPPVFEEMVKLLEKFPMLVGTKVIVTIQVAFGTSERPERHVSEEILNGLDGLVTEGLSRTRVPEPVFLTVITALDVPPTKRVPKFRGSGSTSIWGKAVELPVRVTARLGTFTALEIMIRVVLKLWVDVGVKVRLSVQD